MTTSKTAAKEMPAIKAVVKEKPAPTKPSLVKKPAGAKAAAAVPKKMKIATASTKSASVAKTEVKPRDVKPKKVKLIRDSFKMPSSDYELIDALKTKALGSKAVITKSELLRAGLHALNKLDAAQLIALVSTLAIVKTGRPKK